MSCFCKQGEHHAEVYKQKGKQPAGTVKRSFCTFYVDKNIWSSVFSFGRCASRKIWINLKEDSNENRQRSRKHELREKGGINGED